MDVAKKVLAWRMPKGAILGQPPWKGGDRDSGSPLTRAFAGSKPPLPPRLPLARNILVPIFGDGRQMRYPTQALCARASLTAQPPLVSESDDSEDSLTGPEAITDEELVKAFDATDREKAETPREVPNVLDPPAELDGSDGLEDKVLERAEVGQLTYVLFQRGFWKTSLRWTKQLVDSAT
ncbi:hypothetical protein BU15DRAFT_62639 [Melanogaster broomeanus]|nr:hypothetical protein BU15DRAFT_62639 [Melanogaster broomeanus]